MRFDLGPGEDGIEPVGIDTIVYFEDQAPDVMTPAEEAFISAGLCDREYLARLAMKDIGFDGFVKSAAEQGSDAAVKAKRRPFAGVGQPHDGIVSAIGSARSSNID